MDELTIGDEKYFSSKKAAKVTGYAKDYVGQLCREGRVDARLVGRNWYVLESSIMEHRFGPSESQQSLVEAPREKEVRTIEWESPVYTSEPPQVVPILVEKPYSAASEAQLLPPVSEEKSKDMLSDMQSAWQEWFKTQENKEKELPDASSMLLPVGEPEYPAIVEHTPPPELITEPEYRLPAVPPTQKYEAFDNNERVNLVRRPTLYLEPQKKSFEVFPQRVTTPEPQIERRSLERSVRANEQKKKDTTWKQSQTTLTRRGYSSLISKMLLLAVAGIFVAVTALSVTTTTQSEQGSNNVFYNFINGVSSTK